MGRIHSRRTRSTWRLGRRALASGCRKGLLASADAAIRASIPIEKACADLILVAGGDDALWPSHIFARDLVRRRAAYGKPVSLIFEQGAGHRILLPGEATPRSTLHAHGGNDEADARLGQNAWQAMAALL
ncbi:hypothetical protein I6F07_06825 [Ensifer sp. IC4062]|nr:hypothetical protein [Ensifer sp. IC4062]